MAKDYVAKNAVCPFYHSEREQLVKCEGPVIGTSTHLVLGNKQDKRHYKSLYCQKDYEKCLIHRMLSAFKYEEGRDE